MRTVADEWTRLETALGLVRTTPMFREEMRRIFYSGCAISVEIFHECREMEKDAATAQMSAWQSELSAFILDMSADRDEAGQA